MRTIQSFTDLVFESDLSAQPEVSFMSNTRALNNDTFSVEKFITDGVAPQVNAISGVQVEPDSGLSARLEVADVVDDAYVIQPIVSFVDSSTAASGILPANSNNFSWESVGGGAEIELDPQSGYLLVRPTSDEPVSISAEIVSNLGPTQIGLSVQETPIGSDPSSIPIDQLQVGKAGGGACRTTLNIGESYQFDVEVRASILASAQASGLNERQVTWKNGRYFAYNDRVGNMTLTYNPAKTSRFIMKNPNFDGSADQSFFPAEGENEIFFNVNFHDLGVVASARNPMIQKFEVSDWPPYREAIFNLDEPVEFFDVANPDLLVMRLEEQEMYLYDYNGIEVELLESAVLDEGILQSRWRLTNQSDDQLYARWFILGDIEPVERFKSEGSRLLSRNGSPGSIYEFGVNAQLKPSSLVQKLSMNVVNTRGSVLAGSETIEYRYPI